MVVAVGLVVDDAIVVLENTVRYLDRGVSPIEAAKRDLGGRFRCCCNDINISYSVYSCYIFSEEWGDYLRSLHWH